MKNKMGDKEISRENKLITLYQMAWLNGADGDKDVQGWIAKAKNLLDIDDED